MASNAAAPSRVWLVTGASSGFGFQIALEALRRGDRVIATSRSTTSNSLKAIEAAGGKLHAMDVTTPQAEMKKLAKECEAIYGKIDVLCLSHGDAYLGALEEIGPDGLRHLMEVNFFGVSNVCSAFIPAMRERRDGTILIVGSRSAYRFNPYLGNYIASKAAVNAYSEVLGNELRAFNIRVCNLAPGAFNTEGMGSFGLVLLDRMHTQPGFNLIEDYGVFREAAKPMLANMKGNNPGDPQKIGIVVCDLVRGEGLMLEQEEGSGESKLKPWPKRLLLGTDAGEDATSHANSLLSDVKNYADLTKFTDRSDLKL